VESRGLHYPPAVLRPGTNSGIHWVGGCLCPRFGLEVLKNTNPSSLTVFKMWTSARSESLYADYAMPAREGVCCRKCMNNTIPEFCHEGARRVTLNIRVESIRTWEQNTRPLKYEIRADHSNVTFCDVELRPLKGIHLHRSGSLTSIGGDLVKTDYWLWLYVTHPQCDKHMGQ